MRGVSCGDGRNATRSSAAALCPAVGGARWARVIDRFSAGEFCTAAWHYGVDSMLPDAGFRRKNTPNRIRTACSTACERNGRHERNAKPAERMDLVVPAADRPVRRGVVAAILQQGGAVSRGHAILLLVPAPLGAYRRGLDCDRLLRHRSSVAQPVKRR